MQILITGGAGFIGSHTSVELLEAGYELIVVDNLSNSKEESLHRVQEITGKTLAFYTVDLLDRTALEAVFTAHNIDAVIHFAGFKAVGESVEKPLDYYHNNLTGTLILLQTMEKFGVRSLVSSSSATVYGQNENVPLQEDAPLSAINPYGNTKLYIEQILRDLHTAQPEWNIILLRYFNPVGAHPSGRIGEDPSGVPNNLLPYITQVAVGMRKRLSVFGNDYDTPDGTGIRDYIHVVDLAVGHVKALKKLALNPGCEVYNLGTGRGYSVLEVIAAFEKVTGQHVPYQIVARRPGDVGKSYADPSKANRELLWVAEHDIEDICRDAWNWQQQNPRGYN